MSTPILIADNDTFRSRYVISGLIPLGSTILGPISTAAEACTLIKSGTRLGAVILADRLADGSVHDLLSLVRALEVPHLILIDEESPLREHLATSPVLQRPFASFQVAQWVASL